MPNLEAHSKAVRGNRRLLDDLLVPNVASYPEWTATVAFYAALHAVEAAFTADPRVGHTFSHDERRRALAAVRYEPIWDDYFRLARASRLARYLQAEGLPGVPAFAAHFPPGVVRDDLVGRRLAAVLRFAELAVGADRPGFSFDRPSVPPEARP